MRSDYTHELCDDDAMKILDIAYTDVVRVSDDTPQLCCVCGANNTSGIYYRAKPHLGPYCKAGHKRD